MSEEIQGTEQDRWAEAQTRVADVITRKYPDAEDKDELIKIAKDNLSSLGKAQTLKFIETKVEGESFKTLEPQGSEVPTEGLPVEDVIDYMSLGDSHEFEFGVPDPDQNPAYLQTLSNSIDKPIDAYLPGKEVIKVQPQIPESVS